jgi:predicted enzyme related to lactoylglutathione lyase
MNSVAYFEIQVNNPEKAVTFYTEVFGWKFSKDPNIPVEYYRIENSGPNGGLLKRPCPAPAPEQGTNAYVCSIQVENFDTTSDKILKNGGQVAMPKFAVPGKCWQGYFLDTEGNTFGLFQVDVNAA